MQSLQELVNAVSNIKTFKGFISLDVDTVRGGEVERRVHLQTEVFLSNFKVYETEDFDSLQVRCFVVVKGVQIFCLKEINAN